MRIIIEKEDLLGCPLLMYEDTTPTIKSMNVCILKEVNPWCNEVVADRLKAERIL